MSLTQEIIALSQIEKQRRNHQALSLTNFENDLEPQIAAGGRLEDTDTLFYSGSLESITGWAGIGVSTEAYIKIIPQGDGPPETALAEFTDIAPTWSDSKQGFYGTAAAANHRYIGGLYKDAGGNYTKKYLYEGQRVLQHSSVYFEKSGGLYVGGDIDVDGHVNSYYHNNTGDLLKTAITTIDFYIYKPITVTVRFNKTGGAVVLWHVYLKAYYNGQWLTILDVSGSANGNYYKSICLNPGYYRLENQGGSGIGAGYLYLTGAFGTKVNSNIVS